MLNGIILPKLFLTCPSSSFLLIKERTDENSSHGIRGCWWLLRGTTRPSWVRGGLHCTGRSSRGVAREGACRREQARQHKPPKGPRDRRSEYSGICRRYPPWRARPEGRPKTNGGGSHAKKLRRYSNADETAWREKAVPVTKRSTNEQCSG